MALLKFHYSSAAIPLFCFTIASQTVICTVLTVCLSTSLSHFSKRRPCIIHYETSAFTFSHWNFSKRAKRVIRGQVLTKSGQLFRPCAHFQRLPIPPSPSNPSFALCSVRGWPAIPLSGGRRGFPWWLGGCLSVRVVWRMATSSFSYMTWAQKEQLWKRGLKKKGAERRWGGVGHRGSGIGVSVICTALLLFDKGRWEGAWCICRVPDCLCAGNIHRSFRACWNTKKHQESTKVEGESFPTR